MRVMTGQDYDDGVRAAMLSRRNGRGGGRCAVAPLPLAPRKMIVWMSFVPVILYGLYLIGAPFH
jgi:hypothetical protein